jgi:hypothetical protein
MLITILILLVCIQGVSAQENNLIKWKYDGAVSTLGCNVINGTIPSETNSQECHYGDKILKIVNVRDICGSALTQWTDPQTNKTFNYTTTCGHPFFCDEDGGGIYFEKYGSSEYVGADYLNDFYFGENVWFISKFSGDVCYGTLDLDYFEKTNRIDVVVEGQWNYTTISVSIPPQLHTSTLEVFIDNTPVEFSIRKDFKNNTLVRENSIIEVIPIKTNSSQRISIFPHEVIDPYRVNVTDEKTEQDKTLFLSNPKKQIQIGIHPKEIECKEKFELIFKFDGSPACVKPESNSKLIERGWGVSSLEEIKKIWMERIDTPCSDPWDTKALYDDYRAFNPDSSPSSMGGVYEETRYVIERYFDQHNIVIFDLELVENAEPPDLCEGCGCNSGGHLWRIQISESAFNKLDPSIRAYFIRD